MHLSICDSMASLYKALSGTKRRRGDGEADGAGEPTEVVRNRQRVLLLSSRGVTFRYVLLFPCKVKAEYFTRSNKHFVTVNAI